MASHASSSSSMTPAPPAPLPIPPPPASASASASTSTHSVKPSVLTPAPAAVNNKAATKYASTVATQSDIAKYRGKYKELKVKVREIEMENDQIHLKTLNLKRTIQRLRLERALLYERLESVYDPNVLGYDPTAAATAPHDQPAIAEEMDTQYAPQAPAPPTPASPPPAPPPTTKFIPSVLQPPPSRMKAAQPPASTSKTSARDYSTSEDDDDEDDQEEDHDAMDIDSSHAPAPRSGNGFKVTFRRSANGASASSGADQE